MKLEDEKRFADSLDAKLYEAAQHLNEAASSSRSPRTVERLGAAAV